MSDRMQPSHAGASLPAHALTGQAQFFAEPSAVGKVHGQQSLECHQQTARGSCPTPVPFKRFDDLTLTCDAFLGFDDVPFSLGQVFLPGGAVHRTSGHFDRGQPRPQPAPNRPGSLAILREGGGNASRPSLPGR